MHHRRWLHARPHPPFPPLRNRVDLHQLVFGRGRVARRSDGPRHRPRERAGKPRDVPEQPPVNIPKAIIHPPRTAAVVPIRYPPTHAVGASPLSATGAVQPCGSACRTLGNRRYPRARAGCRLHTRGRAILGDQQPGRGVLSSSTRIAMGGITLAQKFAPCAPAPRSGTSSNRSRPRVATFIQSRPNGCLVQSREPLPMRMSPKIRPLASQDARTSPRFHWDCPQGERDLAAEHQDPACPSSSDVTNRPFAVARATQDRVVILRESLRSPSSKCTASRHRLHTHHVSMTALPR